MRTNWRTQAMVVGLAFVPVNGALAQESASTAAAVITAAEYALREDGHVRTFRRDQVVVDIESAFWSNNGASLLEPGRAAAARLAAKLGARPGRLSSVVDCPQREPTVEELGSGDWGCRMAAGTKAVIQINDPTIESDTIFVWIGIWQAGRDSDGRQRPVGARGREVKLLRDDNGEWVAVGTRGNVAVH